MKLAAPTYLATLASLWLACETPPPPPATPWEAVLATAPALEGRAEYLPSPYVTAGNRLYAVGHQDGTFPPLGWHVTGEMGGIWDHPIKLFDGFEAALAAGETITCLDSAVAFINYPFANRFDYGPVLPGLSVSRLQFVPDETEGMVGVFLLKNDRSDVWEGRLLLTATTDLRPVWLGERSGMRDGPDQLRFDEEHACYVGQDKKNPWYALWQLPGGQPLDVDPPCPGEHPGQGVAGTLALPLSLAPGETRVVPFFFSGSYTSLDSALQTLDRIAADPLAQLEQKAQRYRQIAQTAELILPDPTLTQAYEWIKYNTDWLIREVPEQGRALSAGLPDYPWWFGCDATYALRGVLATGRPELARETLLLLKRLSEETNGNGRIIHEASTNGVVYNPGNVNETPHFASMVWTYYQWTGDRELLDEMYPFIKRGLAWVETSADPDGNFFPDGPGMMEIHGLNSEMIDVAAYTQQAYADAARMATEIGEIEQAEQYQARADSLRARMERAFWVEASDSYADFIGTAREARHLIEDAIIRADTLGKPWAVAELEATRAQIADYPDSLRQGFVLHHNWVVNVPLELGLADSARALRALQTARRFTNPFGMFVTGIDRDESAGSDDGSFARDKKVFSYVGAVMTLPTGVQAIAENTYGRPDTALDYLQRMVRSFSYALPGSMYEVSPDFGMMAQAWNIYALAYPVVAQFFGVQPAAQRQEIRLQPQFPSDWDEARLRSLPVGADQVSLFMERQSRGMTFTLEHQREDYHLILALPAGAYSRWTLNGEEVTPDRRGAFDELRLQGPQQVVRVRP
ncbi:MAG: glycogen debranching protein [Bacteroidetes bacterium]|nr:MAG: glycogen debranching protein [Bacteroidota bacterium]